MTIRSKPASPEYRDNFDRIFRKAKKMTCDRCKKTIKVESKDLRAYKGVILCPACFREVMS